MSTRTSTSSRRECSQEGRIGADPSPGLRDDDRPVRAAGSQLTLNGDRLGDTHDGQVAVDAERLRGPADLTRDERDHRVLARLAGKPPATIIDSQGAWNGGSQPQDRDEGASCPDR